MPKRIATQSVVLVRDGRRIVVKPDGKPFDFTSAEIKEITELSKDALRKPVNESAAHNDEDDALGGGITNQSDSAANPNASVPAPQGAATSPTTGGKEPKPAAPKGDKAAAGDKGKDEEL